MGVFVFYIIKTHKPISMQSVYYYALRVSSGTLIVNKDVSLGHPQLALAAQTFCKLW